jgi:hypothetical protein
MVTRATAYLLHTCLDHPLGVFERASKPFITLMLLHLLLVAYILLTKTLREIQKSYIHVPMKVVAYAADMHHITSGWSHHIKSVCCPAEGCRTTTTGPRLHPSRRGIFTAFYCGDEQDSCQLGCSQVQCILSHSGTHG